MLIKSTQKSIRISPRKLREVVNIVKKGMSVTAALEILTNLSQYAAVPLLKTIKVAQANAVNNHQLSPDSLKIKEIQVGAATTYKRWRPVSRGRAHPILKRTSHLRVILESAESTQAKEK